ncbi:MAG: bifunctional riboflavin kinase/FAD synthetase [Gammaproteobacteria bacterium]|nr:bifunctional riboflavin kinase/FAD synthetase [Gammaproteobacteria bacterium]
MRLIRGLHNLTETLPGCVATIGNFDGLHLGHQYILDRVKKLAAEKKLPGVVITFEPQPLEFFRPDQAPTRLTSLREKAIQLERLNIDCLVCLHFDHSLAQLSAKAFVEQLLVNKLGIRALVIGDDFRFGQGRGGDRQMLEAYGEEHGFDVFTLDTHAIGTERISSTRVREALASGDLKTAAGLLGRSYSNAGRVIHGDKRGRGLGVPTLNIDLKRLHAPLEGVFATRVHQLVAEPLPAISYIGTRPVFNGRRLLLETLCF